MLALIQTTQLAPNAEPMLASPPPPRARRIEFGRYVAVDVLDRGGMSCVFRALHSTTGAPVAIKTTHDGEPKELIGLSRELAALRSLRIPGVIRLRETGVRDGKPWFAMDFVQGGTLADEIGRLHPNADTRRRPSEWPKTSERLEGRAARRWSVGIRPGPRRMRRDALVRALELVRRLCGVLTRVHARGIVHGDVKPSNVLLHGGEAPMLIDFGLARFPPSLGWRDEFALPGAGTVPYASPEQLLGRDVDARGDLFALGCVMYELLTAMPFS